MEEVESTMRVTPQEMEDHREEIEAKAAEYGARIVVSEDTSCPHCAAAGIQVGEDGVIYDAVTGEAHGAAHVTTVGQGNRRARRTARRKAERKARRRNR